MNGNWALVMIAGCLLLDPATSRAETARAPLEDLSQAVSQSAQDLQEGRTSEAIARLEQLADQGQRHPDLAFNRGLAYLTRATGSTPRSGDFGQAAAGFAETLQQRPEDAPAERALEDTQLLAARKRTGEENTLAEPLGLAERVLLALDPMALFVAGALGSLSLTAGVLLWGSRRHNIQTISWLASGIGLLLLCLSCGIELLRRTLSEDHQVAVVIVSRAPLVDESGRPLVGVPPLLETAVVHVKSPMHGLAPLVSLGSAKWIRTSQLRMVSRSRP